MTSEAQKTNLRVAAVQVAVGGAEDSPTNDEQLLSESDKWDGLNHSRSLDSAPNTSMLDVSFQATHRGAGKAKKD
jgi:hypothetical protein